MILLLDIGNTRIKWALHGSADLHAGAQPTAEDTPLPPLREHAGAIRSIIASNVAGSEVAARLSAQLAGLGPIEWIRSEREQCGVSNFYDHEQLGSDRWASLIGARALHRGPCLVITAGTATTIDHLDAEGHFQGGVIVPGLSLMHSSLSRNTAQLDERAGHCVAQPRNTADAIATGCMAAQAGAIAQRFASLALLPDACCLLSGGAAPAIVPHLGALPVRQINNLVLHGLARIADARSSTQC